MDRLQVRAILEEFGGLDGAVMRSIGFEIGDGPKFQSRGWLELDAYRNDVGAWKRLRIEALGSAIFSWTQIFWNTNVVLSFPVEVLEWQGKIVIDFDPLGAKPRRGEVSLSDYYVGGEDIIISEDFDSPRLTNQLAKGP